ncbi:glycoside hydrolase family 3 protein [Suhomyces tanzawaensis NRRL Y-17324]|uniref:Glycoside hydrolase family 3 protein n=1 Tax=Suhomyces tanzawaensis NRRL Y-17324 TaxID=984487 RepID=A0A1E4SCT4_9ASCO|nr:glycoside hydrolase family 3 protein [Suhomyces tanzawaensis NRRL Y-17324]ODV77202.1 glycoside hydrolase family 3 protein [Suhomyces tanzawaensis NRRL Y-17324]
MSPLDLPNFQVGQLLCGGFQGTTVTPQAYHLIVDNHVSSMILSRKNAVSVAQMTKLIRDLQYIAFSQANYKYPIMFAIDEEGGMMNSLFDPDFLTQCPGAMALASTGDTELVYEISKAIAIELKKIGFLIILGPVLDVVTKLSHQLVGVRSFGTTIECVTKYGLLCAKGLRDGGLFTVGKHFPGIGNATVDSLLELPMIGDSLEQIKHFNSVPFAKLIEENLLDGVSAAGCGVPTISPDETHACLSPVLINQLLRQDLKFKGFVVSECLEMDALYHSIGLGQGVVLAISAGCDLVMVCHDFALQNEALESMEKAISNGTLDEETVSASFARIEKLQKQLPKWSELFPRGEASAKEDEITFFKNEFPDLWAKHKRLSELAYQKSITLVRDFNETLPITKFISAGKENVDNILLLTPLLNPIYAHSSGHEDNKQLFTGEEVFQKFGDMLSNHKVNESKPYNVLHTTYTANGLTPLHESLIENSKVVIVLTSEASRNMYQIGIVKYVSILCGADPNSFNNSANGSSQLSKPLIIVATLSPYDLFYNKTIGSAYLCCYDYTNNLLEKLVGVLMGDFEPEGCIPGEKMFVGKLKKDKWSGKPGDESADSHKKLRNPIPKRRWLVDEFELDRDWPGLVKLWMNNNIDTDVATMGNNKIDYRNENFFKKMYGLLAASSKTQRHFVVRNSSLNILYGVVLTWLHDQVALDGDLTKEESQSIGSIMYLLVDKSKTSQSIGKNLHSRAMRYLIKEQHCKKITLGTSFPLFVFPENSNLSLLPNNTKVISFMHNLGWDIVHKDLRKKYVMVLDGLEKWLVPKKIFRELMIVGVRFDICSDPEKLMKLIDRSIRDLAKGTQEQEEIESIKNLYLEAIKHLGSSSPFGVKIIIALEPTNQSVIGSIILFTNKSPLARFYPFMDECVVGGTPKNTPLTGGIVGPVIDPLYSNLTEIFKYGLICSGITFLKSNLNDGEVVMNQCIMVGVNDDKSISGVKEIGFHEWKYYYDYYDLKQDSEKAFKTKH